MGQTFKKRHKKITKEKNQTQILEYENSNNERTSNNNNNENTKQTPQKNKNIAHSAHCACNN